MPALLVLLLVAIPILEIVVIIEVGQRIGVLWTVVLLLATSFVGASLLKLEGARSWRDFQRALREGRWPGDEVARGALAIVGGALLVAPGFVTDAIGLGFLIPDSRRIQSGTVRSRFSRRVGGRALGRDGRDHRRTGRRRTQRSTFDVEVVEIHREERRSPAQLDEGGGEDDVDEHR